RAAGSARRRWSAVPPPAVPPPAGHPQSGHPQSGHPQSGYPHTEAAHTEAAHTEAAHTEAPRAVAPGEAVTPRIEPAAAGQTPEITEPLPPGVPANWRSGPRSRPYRG